RILVHKDEAPEWVKDLSRAAHDDGRILPDDWRFEFIGDALDLIGDMGDVEDVDDIRERFREWFGGGAYVYTAEQLAWIASSGERPGYCDEAAEEFEIGRASWRERGEIWEVGGGRKKRRRQ